MPFWNNKNILVTGGPGFLGPFIVDKLKEKEVNGRD
jgi:nucleoside-diphosphate-sugar epimerase